MCSLRSRARCLRHRYYLEVITCTTSSTYVLCICSSASVSTVVVVSSANRDVIVLNQVSAQDGHRIDDEAGCEKVTRRIPISATQGKVGK